MVFIPKNKLEFYKIIFHHCILCSIAARTLSFEDPNIENINGCKMENGKMHKKNEPLALASDKMWEKFEATCGSTSRCLMDVGNETSLTYLNYMGMRETEAYVNVRKTCHDLGTAENPTTLCKVNSFLKVPGDNTISFVSKREPVCFHYDCGDHQVDFVDPRPLGCNPETHDCIITNIVADCPERPSGAGLGNCKKSQATILEDEAYSSAKNELNLDLGAYCKGEKENPIDDPICTYEHQPISIMVSENFRHFETDPIYKDYSRTCYASGGQTCFLSLNARAVGKVLLFDLDVTGDYNDFPMCFPSTCDHDVKEALAKELISANLSNRISEAVRNFTLRRRLEDALQPGGKGTDIKNALSAENQHLKNLNIEDRSQIEFPCPLGLQDCSVVVADFYCTGKDGEPIDPSLVSLPLPQIEEKTYWGPSSRLVVALAVLAFIFFAVSLYLHFSNEALENRQD